MAELIREFAQAQTLVPDAQAIELHELGLVDLDRNPSPGGRPGYKALGREASPPARLHPLQSRRAASERNGQQRRAAKHDSLDRWHSFVDLTA
jgi:hypothetical protein